MRNMNMYVCIYIYIFAKLPFNKFKQKEHSVPPCCANQPLGQFRFFAYFFCGFIHTCVCVCVCVFNL